MLRTLRAAAKTKVATVIIGALVLAFALWGVNDIFHGNTNENIVADVGGTPVASGDYDRELRAQIRAMSEQTKTDVTMEQARAYGLDRAVLDNVIARAAFDVEDRRLGLTASDDAIAAKIRGTNQFLGADGAFSRPLFQQAIQQAGYTENAFLEATRNDIARAQLLNATSAGFIPPPGLTHVFFDFVNETRTAEYVVLSPADAGKIAEPTDADLAAYHKAHADQFSAPEMRNIQYVEISPAAVADKITVTDPDLQAEYANQKAKYEKQEQRDIEQISFPTKEAADAAAARLKSGTDFTAIARERGLKDSDVKLGTLAASGLAPQLSQAAFAVPEGGTTAPVQGPFGWVILHTVHVVPGEKKTFDQVKNDIRADLVKARAQGQMSDLANAFEDARGGGASIADAAKKLNLTVHRVPAVDAQGKAPDGTNAAVPEQPAFLQKAFATESGEESDIFQTDDGNYYVIQVDGVTPAAVKPFEQVRAAVHDGWMAQARTDALKKRAETLADDARKGSFAGAAKTLGKMPTTSMAIRRDQPSDVFAAPLLQQIFSQPQGAVVTGNAAKGDGYVVARIADVTHPQADVNSAEYADFRKAIAQQLANDLAETLAVASRANVGVTTHPAAIQAVLGGEPAPR